MRGGPAPDLEGGALRITHYCLHLQCPFRGKSSHKPSTLCKLRLICSHVVFQEVKDTSLASRWSYLISDAPNTSIQWVSIINSVLVVFFLTILVAIVLVRTLYRDFLRYDKLDSDVSFGCTFFVEACDCLISPLFCSPMKLKKSLAGS